MPDVVTTKYIWPPNFDGTPPTAGQPGWARVEVQLTGISDGTGESAVKKIDISTLRRPDGQAVVRTAVERIEYESSGFTSLLLEWDRTLNETIAVLPGGAAAAVSGDLDYRAGGGLAELSDGSAGTGDILLTSSGASAGDSYNIRISLILM